MDDSIAQLLADFESGLNPQNLADSAIPGEVLGYGEISTVFRIREDDEHAFKRMPLFADRGSAEQYAENYRQYCRDLNRAGLTLPEDDVVILEPQGKPVTLYIVQQQFPSEWFAHQLLHTLENEPIAQMVDRIGRRISGVWEFNKENSTALRLALDGQLSNWIFENGDTEDGELYYIDTSTPMFQVGGVEQLDPELFLKSAPGFLRWIIRLFFLDDVMNRYYRERDVFIDLAANLYKEQRTDIIEMVVTRVNKYLPEHSEPIAPEDVESYYREDKLIWRLFLAFRRLDRWIQTRILRRSYEHILPGKITR